MARFVMCQTKEIFERFHVQFSKILDDIDGDGYHWHLVIRLNRIFGDSVIELSREETVYAVGRVSTAIRDWAATEEQYKEWVREYN